MQKTQQVFHQRSLRTARPTTASTIGDPQLGVSGLPYLGNAGFGFEVSGMLPNTSYNFLLGTSFPGGGIDVSPFLPTPVGLTLWIDLNFSGNPPLATDMNGDGSFPVPLSTDVNQIGLSLWAQAFQADPGLFGGPVSIPLSATKAIKFTIGAF